MKFCKKFQDQERLPGVSYVEFKKFKKILKHCTVKCNKQSSTRLSTDEGNSSAEVNDINAKGDGVGKACRTYCPVCDRTFFPSLLNEMTAVVCCFNTRAKQLLELHLATGFRKYLAWLTSKRTGDHLAMIKEGENLVKYASINALAMRKILKKYDKVHYSKQGREFKAHVQAMQMEILQSPWLSELIAFRINLMNSRGVVTPLSELYGDYSLNFDGEKPSMSCTLLDSVKLDIDLTCSICLARVFGDAVRLCELSILLSRSCQEYWEQRLQREKVERLRQAKEHWENQCRAFMGF